MTENDTSINGSVNSKDRKYSVDVCDELATILVHPYLRSIESGVESDESACNSIVYVWKLNTIN